ncbi:hypothetical protein EDD18DRAFT_1205722 [Armillaria luteobubalina]|uniref:Uncharacterized protein n=1 Tax=Armillaria luteobubalina TaxID=153913 RepID=A0AA39TCR2_9AGAR|nr:hypothetical protein EDD18DRAFT_1205722 [Armillaria luteobubalina]
MERSDVDIFDRVIVLVSPTKKYEQHKLMEDADGTMTTKHYPRTKTGHILEGEGRRKEKRKNWEVGQDTESKKPRLSTSTSTSSTSAYTAIIELWEKTMEEYDDHITQLQEQLWEQQEKSESLARTYNEETRAARLRISELETENAALKEKVGLTRKAMEGLKNLMEL